MNLDYLACVEGTPVAGTLDQAFALLTVDADGLVDVCLLSRTELASTGSRVRLVVASTKARRNLKASGQATLVAVVDNAARYLALKVERTVEGDGAMAVEASPVRLLTDDLGIELRPILFRVDERLRVDERWDRTERLLSELASTGATP